MEAKHRLLFLDFETYYDDQYSLRNLPIPNYLLDPRFEAQMLAVKEGIAAPKVIDGPDIPAYLAQYDPAHTTTVCFNALFDNSILAWRYGFVPVRMLDAMGMARSLRGHILHRASLESVAKELGLGEKLGTLVKVKGMSRQQIIQAGLWDEFKKYSCQDVELCARIFLSLINEFPISERRLMDLVLRCAVVPRFVADKAMLGTHLADVQLRKSNLLKECGVSVDELMSTEKFKKALENRGVVVEYKTNAKGKPTPAFAKTDNFMAALEEHPDPTVQALAAARLGHKSTLEETRTSKLLGIAKLNWPAGLGNLPIPLRFGGAHTLRLSGDWGMNMQNLPRSVNKASKLRKALKAPEGSKVITVDLGQIEARLVAWISGAHTLLSQFANKEDPYAKLAEAIFGYPVNRKVQILEGFIGKTGILGLGYGCGVDKFFNMVRVLARAMGIDLGEKWTKDLASKAVSTYRRVNPQIPTAWRQLDFLLSTAWLGKSGPVEFGPVTIGHGCVIGPGGLITMHYDNPRRDPVSGDLFYNYGREVHKIYGAKLLENIIQFLARIIVMDAALRIAARGHNFVLQAHDELVFIVRDDEVDMVKKMVHTEMTMRPWWAPDLPLSADVGVGQSYGDAK